MKRLLIGIALASLASVVIAAGWTAGVSDARPRAEAPAQEPSSTPGVAPRNSSTVYVRYTLDEVPLAVTTGRQQVALVDGAVCGRGVFTDVITTIVEEIPWPWSDDSPCNRTGVPVRICRDIAANICSDEFEFQGEDVQVDWELGRQTPELLDMPALTVAFGHAGVEQPVTLRYWLFRGVGAGNCGDGSEFPAHVSRFIALWGAYNPTNEACTATGLDVEATFVTDEFGELGTSFTWTGESTTVDVDTGALLATPTPSPSAPAPTEPTFGASLTRSPATTPPEPMVLPTTGGSPARQHSFVPGVGAILALAAAAVVANRLASSRRR